MIASSTIAPTAIAIPPSVMLLIVAPVSFIASTAASSDSGIAMSVIDAARKLARNRNTIRTTRMPPSRSARVRLSIAVSMKSAWRKMFRWIAMPAGSDACSSSRTPSRRRVRSSVLAPGCFWMPMTIAGFAVVRAFAAPERGTDRHLAEVPDQDRPSLAGGDHGLADLLEALRPADPEDQVLLAARDPEARRRVPVRLAQRMLDLAPA